MYSRNQICGFISENTAFFRKINSKNVKNLIFPTAGDLYSCFSSDTRSPQKWAPKIVFRDLLKKYYAFSKKQLKFSAPFAIKKKGSVSVYCKAISAPKNSRTPQNRVFKFLSENVAFLRKNNSMKKYSEPFFH